MIQYLIIGITYAFTAVVQPGPFQVFLLSQTLSKGWRHTLPAAFGPLISDLPVILIVLLLLTNVPPHFINILQIGGGLFLLYLAFSAYKTFKNFNSPKLPFPHSNRQTLFSAVMVNLLNPNPYLGWSLVLGPLLLKGWHQNPANGIVLLVSFYATLTIGMIATIFIFAASGKFGSRLNRLLIGISVIALACFGFYELWSGLSGLNYKA
jgi:threonine/homoserine/homoserine lactone efflux protein